MPRTKMLTKPLRDEQSEELFSREKKFENRGVSWAVEHKPPI